MGDFPVFLPYSLHKKICLTINHLKLNIPNNEAEFEHCLLLNSNIHFFSFFLFYQQILF